MPLHALSDADPLVLLPAADRAEDALGRDVWGEVVADEVSDGAGGDESGAIAAGDYSTNFSRQQSQVVMHSARLNKLAAGGAKGTTEAQRMRDADLGEAQVLDTTLENQLRKRAARALLTGLGLAPPAEPDQPSEPWVPMYMPTTPASKQPPAAAKEMAEVMTEKAELKQERRDKRRGAETGVIVMLVVSYADLASDIFVAITLIGTQQQGYAIASFAFWRAAPYVFF